jgi:hypothetical protein
VTRCDSGWTEVGDKCFLVGTGPANYLIALTSCIGLGGNLATIETQAEQVGIGNVANNASSTV